MIPVGKIHKRNLSVIRRQQMIRIGAPMPVKEFFALLDCTPRDERVEVFGVRVSLNSQRYNLFRNKGVKCTYCGREGKVFILEKSHKSDISPHFNLYAIEPNGSLVLMTRDHIIPKSRGGSSIHTNLQPLCCKCNCKKDNKLEGELAIFKQ
jgi:hypothetical protein